MITIPSNFATGVAGRGPAAQRWLAALPQLVEEICAEWQLTIVVAINIEALLVKKSLVQTNIEALENL